MPIKEFLKKHFSLLESFFSLSVLNGLALLFPFITMPYILRVVGAEKYGIYGFVYILIQYVLIFNTYGFDYSATKDISQHRHDTGYVNRVFNTVIVCRLILFVSVSAVFLVLSYWLLPGSIQKMMFLGGLTLVLGNTFIPVWLFQGLEKMRYMPVVNLTGKSVFLILVFVLIRRPEHYVYLPLIDGLGYVASGIMSLIIAFGRLGMRFQLPAPGDIRRQFKEGAALFGSTVGMTLYRKSNIFILKFFIGDSALGIYTVAEKIIHGLQMAVSPVSQALFPHLGHNFAGRSLKENLKLLRKVSGIMALLLAVYAVLTVVFSRSLINLLGGPDFADARMLLVIMSPVLFFGGLNYLLGIVGLVNLNRSPAFLTGVLLAGAVSVSWTLLAAPTLGATAGAWAATFAEIVLFVSCLTGLFRLHLRV